MNAASALVVENLAGGYGDVVVVRNVSVRVATGSIVFVTGRNGVGKTTFVKLIAGHLPVMSGSVSFCGRNLVKEPAHARRATGIGYAPQEAVIFDNLTVRENLTLQYADRGLERYDGLFASFPRLHERREQRAGTLSGGEKKLLSFCRALAEDTSLVILDEPTEGVQPENIELMAGHLLSEMAGGRSFLIVEQNLGLVERTASHVYVIDHGECVFETPSVDGLRQILATKLAL